MHADAAKETVFVLVDVQGKLAEIVYEKDILLDNLQRLIKGMRILKAPIIWVEQTPDKMGPTLPALVSLLTAESPISKSTFNCCDNPIFMRRLESFGRKHVVMAGIESHVCVYQTATDLVSRGYRVEVVADAVSSRTAGNKQIALGRIQAAGAKLTSVEMILFELMKTADHVAFRDILAVVK